MRVGIQNNLTDRRRRANSLRGYWVIVIARAFRMMKMTRRRPRRLDIKLENLTFYVNHATSCPFSSLDSTYDARRVTLPCHVTFGLPRGEHPQTPQRHSFPSRGSQMSPRPVDVQGAERTSRKLTQRDVERRKLLEFTVEDLDACGAPSKPGFFEIGHKIESSARRLSAGGPTCRAAQQHTLDRGHLQDFQASTTPWDLQRVQS
ncbi:hypothetical protein L210DRAFT_2766937 [Boletus edulis BED1]|uniref:Uncharacterized protein n=1 Tax=Boletus edulis BED1 TaxID=1328754 RepID=A0AAD4BK38_BOLED|nr:hypothetical protein L210DRAFT_2766937 [Boletus edulis BED1]